MDMYPLALLAFILNANDKILAADSSDDQVPLQEEVQEKADLKEEVDLKSFIEESFIKEDDARKLVKNMRAEDKKHFSYATKHPSSIEDRVLLLDKWSSCTFERFGSSYDFLQYIFLSVEPEADCLEITEEIKSKMKSFSDKGVSWIREDSSVYNNELTSIADLLARLEGYKGRIHKKQEDFRAEEEAWSQQKKDVNDCALEQFQTNPGSRFAFRKFCLEKLEADMSLVNYILCSLDALNLSELEREHYKGRVTVHGEFFYEFNETGIIGKVKADNKALLSPLKKHKLNELTLFSNVLLQEVCIDTNNFGRDGFVLNFAVLLINKYFYLLKSLEVSPKDFYELFISKILLNDNSKSKLLSSERYPAIYKKALTKINAAEKKLRLYTSLVKVSPTLVNSQVIEGSNIPANLSLMKSQLLDIFKKIQVNNPKKLAEETLSDYEDYLSKIMIPATITNVKDADLFKNTKYLEHTSAKLFGIIFFQSLDKAFSSKKLNKFLECIFFTPNALEQTSISISSKIEYPVDGVRPFKLMLRGNEDPVSWSNSCDKDLLHEWLKNSENQKFYTLSLSCTLPGCPSKKKVKTTFFKCDFGIEDMQLLQKISRTLCFGDLFEKLTKNPSVIDLLTRFLSSKINNAADIYYHFAKVGSDQKLISLDGSANEGK